MTAKNETLYRDAPFIGKLDRIDEAWVPDCGGGAVARLRAENARRDRQLWYLTTALWLTLCVCILGVATIREAPFIVFIGFIAARDVLIMIWVSRDRAGLAQRAIEEIQRLQGAERIACEERLRAAVAAWNAEADGWAARLAATEWLSTRQGRMMREGYRLRESRRHLMAEIEALRTGSHAAA